MDTEFLTVTKIGKQTAECKIDIDRKMCYIRVTIPKIHITFLPVCGIPIIPWIYTHKYVVYYDGWEYDWNWSDHYIREKATYCEKMDGDEHEKDVQLLHGLWLEHSVRLVTTHVSQIGTTLQSLLMNLLTNNEEQNDNDDNNM